MQPGDHLISPHTETHVCGLCQVIPGQRPPSKCVTQFSLRKASQGIPLPPGHHSGRAEFDPLWPWEALTSLLFLALTQKLHLHLLTIHSVSGVAFRCGEE